MPEAPAPPYLGPAHFAGGGDNKPINRIVIHCTVSPTVQGGARATAAYFRSAAAGGSAHYVVDPYEVVQCVYDGTVAYHAPPNQHSLGVELCDPMKGKAARWQWLEHEAMLHLAARLVAQLCLAYDVPIVRLSEKDLRAGKHGICGHVDVSQAFKQSTHWDPGPDFPWPRFMALVKGEAAALAKPSSHGVAGRPPTLRRGSKRPSWIMRLQHHPGINVKATGIYDAPTRAAVRAFKRRHHIWPATGTTGARVWKALGVK
jgi:N-acetyl-anhydromuramyl-L-alanine amidase AmpD